MYIFKMKNILLIFIIAFTFISCSRKIVYVPVNHVETLTETIRDTVVNYKIVPEYKFIETKDSISRLETSYAISTCKTSNGILSHQLQNKDTNIQTVIQYKDVYKTIIDSVGYPVKGDTITKTETNYTGWYFFIILSLLVVVYILIKKYGKIF